MELIVEDIKSSDTTTEGYMPLFLETSRGVIEGRYYEAPNATSAMIYVGGIGGGFDTPARGLYPRLCRELLADNISGLRLKYRNPIDLEEAILDVLAGIAYLEKVGIKSVGLVGHSFGGAVVIQAAALSHIVKTVITLATQSSGADSAKYLFGKSLLSVHGEEDEILPTYCSVLVQEMAPGPKWLIRLKGTRHNLNEQSDRVHKLTRGWVLEGLSNKNIPEIS